MLVLVSSSSVATSTPSTVHRLVCSNTGERLEVMLNISSRLKQGDWYISFIHDANKCFIWTWKYIPFYHWYCTLRYETVTILIVLQWKNPGNDTKMCSTFQKIEREKKLTFATFSVNPMRVIFVIWCVCLVSLPLSASNLSECRHGKWSDTPLSYS